MRILVVDDDTVISEVLAVMLKRSGFEVALAEDGVKAIEIWEKGDFDLILLDVQMPFMDGFETTRAIRAKEVVMGGHTIIVAITAFALHNDKVKCLEAGMDAYVSKPVNIAKLIELIRELGQRNNEPTLRNVSVR